MNNTLRKKILEMVKEDQRIRKDHLKIIQKMEAQFPDPNDPERKKIIKRITKELKDIDTKDTREMKEIIKKYGWPGKKLVGKRGASGAWLLVQHADKDLIFQEKCLKLLEEAVKSDQAEKKYLAFLTDRILVHKKKKQIYGTQMTRSKKGAYIPFPIQNPKKVDERRKGVGLDSLADYKKRITESYGPKK